MVERVLRTVLLNCGMGETVVERFLEDDVSSMSGSYSGRIFQDGLLESMRQQADFEYTDEYRLLGLKQLVIDAA